MTEICECAGEMGNYRKYVESINWERAYCEYVQAHTRVRLPSINKVVPVLGPHHNHLSLMSLLSELPDRNLSKELNSDMDEINQFLDRVMKYRPTSNCFCSTAIY